MTSFELFRRKLFEAEQGASVDAEQSPKSKKKSDDSSVTTSQGYMVPLQTAEQMPAIVSGSGDEQSKNYSSDFNTSRQWMRDVLKGKNNVSPEIRDQVSQLAQQYDAVKNEKGDDGQRKKQLIQQQISQLQGSTSASQAPSADSSSQSSDSGDKESEVFPDEPETQAPARPLNQYLSTKEIKDVASRLERLNLLQDDSSRQSFLDSSERKELQSLLFKLGQRYKNLEPNLKQGGSTAQSDRVARDVSEFVKDIIHHSEVFERINSERKQDFDNYYKVAPSLRKQGGNKGGLSNEPPFATKEPPEELNLGSTQGGELAKATNGEITPANKGTTGSITPANKGGGIDAAVKRSRDKALSRASKRSSEPESDQSTTKATKASTDKAVTAKTVSADSPEADSTEAPASSTAASPVDNVAKIARKRAATKSSEKEQKKADAEKEDDKKAQERRSKVRSNIGVKLNTDPSERASGGAKAKQGFDKGKDNSKEIKDLRRQLARLERDKIKLISKIKKLTTEYKTKKMDKQAKQMLSKKIHKISMELDTINVIEEKIITKLRRLGDTTA